MNKEKVSMPAAELLKVFELMNQQANNAQTCCDILKRPDIDKYTAAGAVETASEILGYLQKETEELIATFKQAADNTEFHL